MTLGGLITIGSGLYNEFRNIKTSFNDVKSIFDGVSNSFGGENCSGAFMQSGYNTKTYKDKLREAQDNAKDLQHADVFLFQIHRAAPYFNMEQSHKISTLAKSVNIQLDGAENQEDKIGSGYYNWRSGTTSGQIEVTFYEFKEANVISFLTKISKEKDPIAGLLQNSGIAGAINSGISLAHKIENSINVIGGLFDKPSLSSIGGTVNKLLGGLGISQSQYNGNKNENIIPSDGTFLLPMDYYFEIKMSHVFKNKILNMTSEKVIIEDKYIIDGNIGINYETGDERFVEITATFKPMKSWRG